MSERAEIGGRRLAYALLGEGEPAAVFVSASGLDMRQWRKVIAVVAPVTRTLTYDRAGLGDSDPPPGIRGHEGALADFEAVIEASGIALPCVLVGASAGAYVVRLFAHRHPQAVAGLVFIDPQHEDRLSRAVASLSADEAATLKRERLAELSNVAGPELFHGNIDLTAELMHACWPLPRVPTAVIVRGLVEEGYRPAGIPPEHWEAVHQQLARELAARLPGSMLRVAGRSRHHVTRDEPELVAQAVLDVVQAVRSGQPVPER